MDNRLSSQDREGVKGFWQGTEAHFAKLLEKGKLVKNRIYFIGDSTTDILGFFDSKKGRIVVATSESTYIEFSSRGEKGEKGEKGDKGDKGDDGQVPDLDELYAKIAEKTSMVDVVAWYQAGYDPAHANENEYQKILSFRTDSFIVLNATKSVFGSPVQNTIFLSSQADTYLATLFDWGFVCKRQGQICTLYLPTFKYNTPAVGNFKFQIVMKNILVDDIVWYDRENVYEIVNKVDTARVVYRPAPPEKENSLQFNITGGLASISMAEATDYIGNITDTAQSAVISTTGEKASRQYRFTFTKTLPNGCKIVGDGGVVYCEITEQILQGDVITFTSVSNTENGWIYSKTGAGIISSDGSVNIDWVDGQADLSVSGGGGSDDYQLKSNMLTSRNQIDGASSEKYPSANAITSWVYYINIGINTSYDGLWRGVTKSISELKGTSDPLLTRNAIMQYIASQIKDITDNEYGYADELYINDEDGTINGMSGAWWHDISILKKNILITKEALNSWIQKYKPATREKKIYYIEEKHLGGSFYVPEDADMVILRRMDIKSSLSVDEMTIKIVLPQTQEQGKVIEISSSKSRYDYSTGTGDDNIDLAIVTSKNLSYTMSMVWSGQARRFVWTGNVGDDNDGWSFS